MLSRERRELRSRQFLAEPGPPVRSRRVQLELALCQIDSDDGNFAVADGTHRLNPLPPYLRRERQANPVPPEPHGLVADFDATLVQQVLHIP